MVGSREDDWRVDSERRAARLEVSLRKLAHTLKGREEERAASEEPAFGAGWKLVIMLHKWHGQSEASDR